MREAGTFRVEEFRVPLMRAGIEAPAQPLVNAVSAQLGVQVSYLAGGSAAFAPVKLRSVVQPRTVSFPGYDEFTLANGAVREGVQADRRADWYQGDYLLSGEEAEAPAGADADAPAGEAEDASSGEEASGETGGGSEDASSDAGDPDPEPSDSPEEEPSEEQAPAGEEGGEQVPQTGEGDAQPAEAAEEAAGEDGGGDEAAGEQEETSGDTDEKKEDE